jgi:indole-3-glycerol phosphate synthase
MILDKIVAATKKRVARDKEQISLLKLEAMLPNAPGEKPLPFASALKHPDRLGLIAEIKKASPSKGVIAPEFDHRKIAELYRDSPADCLSVLTEPQFFQGELQYLREAKKISGKPCLRKDFIVDEYQVAQARLFGADCILLIVAALKDWEIRQLKAAAKRLGMEALVEIHDETEAKRAIANGCNFIGINNRNLQTFEVNLATTEKLRPLLPNDAVVVGESGVFTNADAKRLRAAGCDAILVGESLMRSENPATAMRQLLEV